MFRLFFRLFLMTLM